MLAQPSSCPVAHGLLVSTPRTFQKPDHGHSDLVRHPERVVHLSGLMHLDIGYYPKERVPLLVGWLTDLGFHIKHNNIKSVLGQPFKKEAKPPSAAGDAARVKRRYTGRYLVTLPTSAEAERLAREIHGLKYAVTSKLVRQCTRPLISPRWC